MKNQRGFTLIEMMVTVAVVVVLSAGATTAITTYIGHANTAASGVSSHNNKYSAAQSEVNNLNSNSISGGTTAETTAPTTTTATTAAPTTTTATTAAPTTTTATTAAPTTTTATPTTATPTSATPTTPTSATPTTPATPTQLAGTSTAISNAWGSYAYSAVFTIPSVSKTSTVTIILPAGAVATQWYSCTLVSQVGQTVTITVPANNSGPALLITYSGSSTYSAIVTKII